jgi:hypothetical protein
MPKKSKFKYQVGKSVKFRFYDGSIHNGVIESRGYRNESVDYLPTEYSQPMYTCHSIDTSGRYSRGYMIYTVTCNMIKDILTTPIIIKPLADYPIEEKVTKPTHIPNSGTKSTEPTLDQAIEQQRQFLNR